MRCALLFPILALVLLSTAAAQVPPPVPAAPEPADSLAPGPFEVRSIRFDLPDAERNKQLPLMIRLPVSGNADEASTDTREPKLRPAAPLIIFSHGAGGSRDVFADLSAHWASHGYIVIHPTHGDSIELRRRAGNPIRSRDQLRSAVQPLERHADILLILDSLEAFNDRLAAEAGPGAPSIDEARIAIAGHSAGALTAQLIAGARTSLPRPIRTGRTAPRSLADDRIRAAIIISGQGTTTRIFTEDSWREITIPMMVLAGSRDVAAIGNETPQSRRHPFEFARAGDNNKYLIYIEGATHGSYAGKETSRLLREEPVEDIDLITDIVAAGTTAFLDHHLRESAAAAAYLAGDSLTKLGEGRVEYQRK